MRKLLLLLACLFLVAAAAGATREITKTLSANGDFDVSEVTAGGVPVAITLYSDGVDGGGTLTFYACVTADSGSCAVILDVSGKNVSCNANSCKCTQACIAQVKTSGSGPYKVYRFTLTGATAPTLALKALIYKE